MKPPEVIQTLQSTRETLERSADKLRGIKKKYPYVARSMQSNLKSLMGVQMALEGSIESFTKFASGKGELGVIPIGLAILGAGALSALGIGGIYSYFQRKTAEYESYLGCMEKQLDSGRTQIEAEGICASYFKIPKPKEFGLSQFIGSLPDVAKMAVLVGLGVLVYRGWPKVETMFRRV